MNPKIPAKLEEIISKAMEKDRNLRYQSAAEMRTDLQRLRRDTSMPNVVPNFFTAEDAEYAEAVQSFLSLTLRPPRTPR